MQHGGVLTQSMLGVHVSWADHRDDVNCMSSTAGKSEVLAEEDSGCQHELEMLTVRLCKLADIGVSPVDAVLFAEFVSFLLAPA